jgi:hypothetical protein
MTESDAMHAVEPLIREVHNQRGDATRGIALKNAPAPPLQHLFALSKGAFGKYY